MGGINKMYNQTATTAREGFVEGSTIKKTFGALLESFPCHVQPVDASVIQDIQDGFGKSWLMVCPVADIKEGDRVTVDGTDEYRVGGVESYTFSRNPHMELSIRAWK